MEDQLKQLHILREELAAVRDQFTLKTMLLTRKIDTLEKEFIAANVDGAVTNKTLRTTTHQKAETTNYQQAPATGVEPIAMHSQELRPDPLSRSNQYSSSVKDSNAAEKIAQPDIHLDNIQSHTPKPRKPNLIDVFFTQIMSLMFEWFSPVTAIYESYKARGMLGIFFLTVAAVYT